MTLTKHGNVVINFLTKTVLGFSILLQCLIVKVVILIVKYTTELKAVSHQSAMASSRHHIGSGTKPSPHYTGEIRKLNIMSLVRPSVYSCPSRKQSGVAFTNTCG